jgi:hypothetical protein
VDALNRRRRRGDCSILILLLLGIVVGGWFFFQRRDFERKTSSAFLEELKRVTVELSEGNASRPDGKAQIYVNLKNGSNRAFEGRIVVLSLEISGIALDQATLTVMTLPPGGSTVLTAWLRKSSIQPRFSYEIDGRFR